MPEKATTSVADAAIPKGLRDLRELLRRDLDYRSFYSRYCLIASTNRRRIHTRCPIPSHYHSGDGKPSLSIDLRTGLFNCFSRKQGGDAIAFYQLIHGFSFSQAVRRMAREAGFTTTAVRQVEPALENVDAQHNRGEIAEICTRFLDICRAEDQREGINYLSRRGIDKATIEKARVTYFPRKSYKRVIRRLCEVFTVEQLKRSGLFNEKGHLTFYLHRLLFPFIAAGQPNYLQARTIATGVEPRWHNMRGPVPSLYNVDALQKCSSGAIVHLVEGLTDTLTLMKHGFQAVGLVGVSGLRASWVDQLKPFQVVAVFDPDDAGVSAARDYQRLFREHGQRLASVKLSCDVNDFFNMRASAALELELLTEAALDSRIQISN